MNTFTIFYYNTLVPWNLSFLYDSFKNPLPWTVTNEDGESNEIWNSDYFHNVVLERTETINEGGGLNPRIVIFSIIAYIAIYFALWKGIKGSTKVAYVTVPAPYILLTILLIKGLTLDGAGEGLKFLFKPDMSKLANIKVW